MVNCERILTDSNLNISIDCDSCTTSCRSCRQNSIFCLTTEIIRYKTFSRSTDDTQGYTAALDFGRESFAHLHAHTHCDRFGFLYFLSKKFDFIVDLGYQSMAILCSVT